LTDPHRAAVDAGRRLAFTTCEFTSNGRLVLAASGVFATTARKDSQP